MLVLLATGFRVGRLPKLKSPRSVGVHRGLKVMKDFCGDSYPGAKAIFNYNAYTRHNVAWYIKIKLFDYQL